MSHPNKSAARQGVKRAGDYGPMDVPSWVKRSVNHFPPASDSGSDSVLSMGAADSEPASVAEGVEEAGEEKSKDSSPSSSKGSDMIQCKRRDWGKPSPGCPLEWKPSIDPLPIASTVNDAKSITTTVIAQNDNSGKQALIC